MINRPTNFKIITCAVIMLFITVATALNAQTPQSSNCNAEKPVKVFDGKVMPSDFDLSTVKSESIESVNVIRPDSINKVADLIALYGENAKNGVVLIKTRKKEADCIETKHTYDSDLIETIPAVEINDKIYTVIEQMPQFPGGDGAMMNLIVKYIRYPESAIRNGIQGRVIVRFIVSETGNVSKTEVLKSIDPACDKEAIRVVQLLPNFIPGKQNGKNVAVWYTLPVTFKLEDNQSKPGNPKLIAIDNEKLPLNFDINVLKADEIDTGYVVLPTSTNEKKELVQKYGSDAEKGVIEIYSKRFKRLKQEIKNDPWDTIARIDPNDKNAIYPLISIDKQPEFKGGNKEFQNFISVNLVYPEICKENLISGYVVVQFIVDKNGKTKDVVVKNKVHQLLADEAIRLIRSLPDWTPGEKGGEKVNVSITVPIKFKIRGVYLLDDNLTTEKESSVDRQLIVLDNSILPYGFDLNWLNSDEIMTTKLIVPQNIEEEKRFRLKYGPASLKGIVYATSKKYHAEHTTDTVGNKIYQVIEQMPQFPGGELELMKYIANNIKYPVMAQQTGVQGRVIVRFVVARTGEVDHVEVIRSLNTDCDKEAVRVVKLLPKFIPGKQKGENVAVWYTLPITFKLEVH